MFKKSLVGLGRFTLKALPVVLSILAAGFVGVGEYREAKKRAYDRAADEYSASGHNPSYKPRNPEPTDEDFKAVRNNFF